MYKTKCFSFVVLVSLVLFCFYLYASTNKTFSSSIITNSNNISKKDISNNSSTAFQKIFEKIETYKLQNEVLTSKLSELSKNLKNLENQINLKQKIVDKLKNELTALDDEISKLEINISTLQTSVAQLDKKLELTQQKLKYRFIYLYKLNQTSLSRAIFNSSTYEDFIFRYNLAKYLLNIDKQKLLDLKKEHHQKNRILIF